MSHELTMEDCQILIDLMTKSTLSPQRIDQLSFRLGVTCGAASKCREWEISFRAYCQELKNLIPQSIATGTNIVQGDELDKHFQKMESMCGLKNGQPI